jgi:WXG100 family type VII secretion target
MTGAAPAIDRRQEVAPNLQVDQTLLAKATADMEACKEECAVLGGVMEDVNSQLAGQWQGMAHSSFAGVFAEFSDAYRKVLTGLQMVQTDLTSAGKTLHINETQVQSQAKGLLSGINTNLGLPTA